MKIQRIWSKRKSALDRFLRDNVGAKVTDMVDGLIEADRTGNWSYGRFASIHVNACPRCGAPTRDFDPAMDGPWPMRGAPRRTTRSYLGGPIRNIRKNAF